MPRFLNLLGLFLKYRLKSAAFWVSMAVLLLLFGSFALLCPQSNPPSAQIGLMYDPDDNALQTACAPLLDSDTLRFVYYPPEALPAMQQDVRAGLLHCAYQVSSNAKPPITVYENEGAFLTPVTDELVFSAWFETQLPKITLSTAERLGLSDRQRILAEIERLQAESNPLEPLLELNATAAPPIENGISLVPLLYAVLVSLFLLCCAFSALLSPDREQELRTLLRLSCPSHPRVPAASATLAQVLLFGALPTLCELLLMLLGVETGYSLFAHFALIGLLAILAVISVLILSHVRSSPALLFSMVLWAATSVVFSGAIVSPEVFGIFSALKYLSPQWYLLQLMVALS